MNGPFGNGFPYTNFHELNMDWIIRIAKDFLDQYTHIQDIISSGETSLDEHTTAGLESLQAEKERLEGLLDAWYTEHSEDIAGELASAISDFRTAAEAIGAEVIASIPDDYTALSNSVDDLKSALSEETRNLWLGSNEITVTGVTRSDQILPAGTYTLSAKIQRGSVANCRMVFYKDSVTTANQLANPYISADGLRNSVTFTLDDTANIIQVLSGAAASNPDTATWQDIQIEAGSVATGYVPHITATDFIARGKMKGVQISTNLWYHGDRSFTNTLEMPFVLSAGNYVVSAEIVSRTSDDEEVSGSNAKIEFINGSTVVTYALLTRNCRGSALVTLPSAITSVKLYARNITQSGNTSTWSNIQIEQGEYLSPYKPYGVLAIPSENHDTDILFEIKNKSITNRTWTYNFIRNKKDHRNIIIRCRSKWTDTAETRENEYVAPRVRILYTTGDNATCYYTMGKKDEYIENEWRMPAFPNYTSGDFKNLMSISVVVPTDITLDIDELTVRYDDKMYRPIESGIKIDTHCAFMFYPEHTVPAVNSAQKCGATRLLVIPKCSSDGVWFAYHDDTFQRDGILRNADGSTITDTTYDNKPFNEIPWSFLENLTVYKSASYGAFPGIKLMRIDEFFTICNKTGAKPMFSMHPIPTNNEVQSLYALAKKYGVLNKLTLKPADYQTSFPRLVNVFGNEIESYGLIATRAGSSDSDVQSLISALSNSSLDESKVRLFVELWIDKATTTQIDMILNAGYGASLATYNHTDAAGVEDTLFVSGADYTYWTSVGVTEFTDNHNTSIGLNW